MLLRYVSKRSERRILSRRSNQSSKTSFTSLRASASNSVVDLRPPSGSSFNSSWFFILSANRVSVSYLRYARQNSLSSASFLAHDLFSPSVSMESGTEKSKGSFRISGYHLRVFSTALLMRSYDRLKKRRL